MDEVSAATTDQHDLDRRDVVAELLRERGDLLVVTGLGAATYDAAAAGDSDMNFYLWGAMGSAAPMGLGLAFAQPDRPVLVVTGDGEILMGLGALATIGVKKPPNLSLVVLNNRRHGETGGQPTHFAFDMRLQDVAIACGIDHAEEIADMDGVRRFRDGLHATTTGTRLAIVRIKAEMPERVLPSRDGAYLKNRFRAAIGVESA